MTTLNISLPDEMTAFLEAEAAQGGYATVSEYLRSVIREVQLRKAKQALEAKLHEALMSGPATPMTREDWDSIEAEVFERLAREQAKP